MGNTESHQQFKTKGTPSMHDKILLGHGSGGRLTRDLVRSIFSEILGDTGPQSYNDGVMLELPHNKIVFTTDSFVVSPLCFPGGDIGTLAISGTVNDLAVSGAQPLYLSLGVILEEGLDISALKQIVTSIAATARKAGVRIVCGDTKVVERGHGDGIFINTAGIGMSISSHDERTITEGDVVIINGTIGDHGMCLLTLRKGFSLHSTLTSDCTPLNGLICSVTSAIPVKWMRDPTRGGVATALNELTEMKPWGVVLTETDLPYHESVNSLSELLGLDPLYSANEGKVLIVVAPEHADTALALCRKHPDGKNAVKIGTVTSAYPGKVVLKTEMETFRTLGILNSDPLPRIC